MLAVILAVQTFTDDDAHFGLALALNCLTYCSVLSRASEV